MPEVGVKTEVEHFELKSVEGGFVDLRQLSYDEMLERQDGAMRVTQRMGVKNEAATIAFANKWSNHFTFKRCIVEHNLTIDGVAIDFSKPEKAFAKLDPKVGAEIEQYIDSLNQEEDNLVDFTTPPSLSSVEPLEAPKDDTENNS